MRRMFSEKQIEKFVEEVIDGSIASGSLKTELDKKANLSGASFTGAVTAPTLKQANANYSYSFNMGANLSGTEVTNIYNRFMEINNVLMIIVNFSVTNPTESAISGSLISYGTAFLSSEMAEKIIDLNGNDATESGGNATICAEVCTMLNGVDSSNGVLLNMIVKNANSANAVGIYVATTSPISIPANTTRYFTARAFLSLI